MNAETGTREVDRSTVIRTDRTHGPVAVARAAMPVTADVLLGVLAPGLGAGRVAAWVGAVLLLGLTWASPLSPGALHWGDAALGLGRPEVAARQYDRVARWTPFRSLQRTALRRGAMVSAVELGDPTRARRQLEWLARITPSAVERADVKEQIASLLLEERQYLEAARLLQESHHADPASSSASRRLVRAAELHSDHGEPDVALAVWEQVLERYPAQHARAKIGRAEILLAQNRALEALALFEDAADRTFDTNLAAVAKLGAATCLERLGNLDEALAELDAADIPAQVRATRRQGLRARLP